MSAEVLREAARLMRERAGAAAFTAPSPWHVDGWEICTDDEEPIETISVVTSGLHWKEASEQRVHVASWHPAVALAVADWLDNEAEWWASGERLNHHALAAASAYLGGDQ